MKSIHDTDVKKCQQHCIGNTGCVAFSYSSGSKTCNLYEGGPYTYGNGKRGTKCYIMKGKLGYFYYNIK